MKSSEIINLNTIYVVEKWAHRSYVNEAQYIKYLFSPV